MHEHDQHHLSRRDFLKLAAGASLLPFARTLEGLGQNRALRPELEARPGYVQGLYLPFAYLGLPKQVEALKKVVIRSGANSLIVDVKNEEGRVHIPSSHPLAPPAQNPEALQELIGWAKTNGIRAIGRQVIMMDRVLLSSYPKLGLKDTRGRQWYSNRQPWVNPYLPEIADYNASLAAEAVAYLGLEEVQVDYVRFPDGNTASIAHPGENTVATRSGAIAGLLRTMKDAVNRHGAPLFADVFGYTAWAWEGKEDLGIGQHVETLGPNVDGLCPMAYPTLYGAGIPEDCTRGCKPGSGYPYEIVYYTTLRMRERLSAVNAAATVTPWIRAFEDYKYGKKMGLTQYKDMQRAARDAGASGVMSWNQRGVYSNSLYLP